jgi:hypothetical protein
MGGSFAGSASRSTSDRREAEEALRESEEHYRASPSVSAGRVDDARGLQHLRPTVVVRLQRGHAKRAKGSAGRALHPRTARSVRGVGRQAVASAGSGPSRPGCAADGHTAGTCRAASIRDATNIVRWIGTSVDIHDRRDRRALRRTEAWLSEAQRLSHTAALRRTSIRRAALRPPSSFASTASTRPGTPSTEAVIRRFHPRTDSGSPSRSSGRPVRRPGHGASGDSSFRTGRCVTSNPASIHLRRGRSARRADRDHDRRDRAQARRGRRCGE